MELIPITEVSKEFDVSTRTLRYYEQIGLIQSDAKKDYAYRVYNRLQLEKLRQVLILRKLRIPLKQILKIFESVEIGQTLEILAKNMRETQDEINYLSNIKDTLNLFIEKLKSNGISYWDAIDVLDIINTLPHSKKLCEHKTTNGFEIKDTAFHSFRRLKDSEVRIITLPPATVASYQIEGDAPEATVSAVIDDFVRKNDLIKIKPDLRRYGFIASYLNPVTKQHGYETWVTIPDDFIVNVPLKKKKFEGGLYAAYMVPFDMFDGWHLLYDWVINSDKYTLNYKDGHEFMQGCLDELLNYVHYVTMPGDAGGDMQLDLLIPVKAMDKNNYSKSNLKRVKNKTVSQLETEAHQGDAKAQWDFAYYFFKGDKEIPVDYQKAVEWYKKAANQGYAKAQCTLGYCYMNSLGLPKNEEEAAKLYEKAALQDYAAAMINLAWCYMGGIGVLQDYQTGKYWFEKAAAQNENLKIKHYAETVLSSLNQLVDRDGITLTFQYAQDLQAANRNNELYEIKSNSIIIKIIITSLSH